MIVPAPADLQNILRQFDLVSCELRDSSNRSVTLVRKQVLASAKRRMQVKR